MSRRSRLVLLLGLLLTGPVPAAAEQEIAVIELSHRLPEELLPLIRPLLDPGDAAVPNRNQLILKASPDTIAEIRALIGQLDRSPHRLLITVAQGSDLSAESLDAQARIRGTVDLDRPGDSNVAVRGRFDQSQGREASGNTQQVQTVEGRSAVIQGGAQVPLPGITPYGYPGVEYRSLTTGFAVTPRLSGAGVTLEIEPWSDRLSRGGGGVVETQGARTILQGGLGEWIEVGGNLETSSGEETGLTGRSAYSQTRNTRIFVKVEDLDAGKP